MIPDEQLSSMKAHMPGTYACPPHVLDTRFGAASLYLNISPDGLENGELAQ